MVEFVAHECHHNHDRRSTCGRSSDKPNSLPHNRHSTASTTKSTRQHQPSPRRLHTDETLSLAASGYESLNFTEDSRTHRAVRTRTRAGSAIPGMAARLKSSFPFTYQDAISLLITLAIGFLLAIMALGFNFVEAILIKAMGDLSDAATWGGASTSTGWTSAIPLSLLAFIGPRMLLIVVAALFVW